MRSGATSDSAARTATTSIRGVVETVFYASPRFSAGRLRAPDGATVSFAGPVFVREHDPVVLTGSWERHPKYGRQFKATELLHDRDLDQDGLAAYLANHPDLPGIGPVKARRIADTFGREFEKVLLAEPERVAKAAGVPLETVHLLRAEWERTRSVNAALTWLSAYGLTYHQVTSLVEAHGNMHIDGVAASAASLVAMAGDRTLIAENAMVMVPSATRRRAARISAGGASRFARRRARCSRARRPTTS